MYKGTKARMHHAAVTTSSATQQTHVNRCRTRTADKKGHETAGKPDMDLTSHDAGNRGYVPGLDVQYAMLACITRDCLD